MSGCDFKENKEFYSSALSVIYKKYSKGSEINYTKLKVGTAQIFRNKDAADLFFKPDNINLYINLIEAYKMSDTMPNEDGFKAFLRDLKPTEVLTSEEVAVMDLYKIMPFVASGVQVTYGKSNLNERIKTDCPAVAHKVISEKGRAILQAAAAPAKAHALAVTEMCSLIRDRAASVASDASSTDASSAPSSPEGSGAGAGRF